MQFNEYSEKETNIVKDIISSLSKEMPVAVLKDKRLWTITTIEDFEDGSEKTVQNDIDQLAFSRLFEEANSENGKISVIQKETNDVVVKIFQNGRLNDFNNFPSVVKINDDNIVGKYLNEDWKNISVEEFANLCNNDDNVELKELIWFLDFFGGKMTEDVKDFDFIPETSFSDKEMNIMAFSDGFLSLYEKEKNFFNDDKVNEIYSTVSRISKIIVEVLFFDESDKTSSLQTIKGLLVKNEGDKPVNNIIENGFKNIDTQKYLKNMVYLEKKYPDIAKSISCNIASASKMVNENINKINYQSKLSR